MRAFLLRRIALLIPTVIGLSILVFGMLRLLPGDVVDIMFSGGDDQGAVQTSAVAKEKVREALGLADPIPVQYVNWVGALLKGDLGTSMRTGLPVTTILRNAIPITLEIAVLAIILSMLVAIPLGILSAVKRDTIWDWGARVGGLIGLSLPSFWLATLILLFTSQAFHWIPSIEYISPVHDPIANLKQMIFPASAIAVQMMAIEMRMTRTAMLEVLGQDYIRTARAKGLRDRLVLYRHGLRNALIPVITVAGLQLGGLLGGAAIIEVIFGLNGVGNILLQAIYNRDYPVVQVISLFIATTFVLVNLGVEMLYAYLDPRIRIS
jgi:peptide/nickel transport system permease protein